MNTKQEIAQDSRQAGSNERLRTRMKRRLAAAARRKRRLTVTNRYETGMVLSEIVTGLFFIAGSICMFYPQSKHIPTVLYLTGSIMMLLRSGLRASYWFRLKELQAENAAGGATGGGDWTR
ncbi:YrhK family protein [Paenibacillus lemnae]|uniref:YrhK domain-containing protein n=1 Tax=Paenibacillus lemnae TaxID=1330551 RepID=A0A848MBK9_PAELE|nr:YrhK family protein [Paenibacillus lemnae]NMO97442.1 hypothetical protein [Paenibacillus lemnae]